jgi:Protein of unknown function (DUF4238)
LGKGHLRCPYAGLVNLREGFFSSPLLRELSEIAGRGEPYPESSAKRHHLVPRFLLARFVRRDSARERIMQLDVRSGATKWVDPAAAASRSRFYRLTDDDGTVHQRFEFYLSRVESHAADAIRRLGARPRALSPGDRATLSIFFALLEGRTIAGLDRISRLAQTSLQTLLAARLADPDAFADDLAEALGMDDPEGIERQRKWMVSALKDGRIKLGNPKEIAVDLLLQSTGDTAQLIYQMRWDLLEAGEGAFVTSDRGLGMHDPDPPYPWSGHAILSSPGAETTIPLDPQHCLLLRPPTASQVDTGVSRIEIDSRRVSLLNLRTYGFASDYIFADSQKVATDVRSEAKRRPRLVVKPRPNHQVMLIDAEAGDDRLAREHRARGWPERLLVRGEPHDYVVLDDEDNAVERSIDMSVLGKSRAMRRLGRSDVREQNIPLDPREVIPIP